MAKVLVIGGSPMFTWKTHPAPVSPLAAEPSPVLRDRRIVTLLPVEIDAFLDVALGAELAAAVEDTEASRLSVATETPKPDFVCECSAPRKRLYLVTDIAGRDTVNEYCDACAELAEQDEDIVDVERVEA